MPKFTVAIPAYKRQFLDEAISSCLQQTFPDFEVVIVDDASPEDLASVVGTFRDERIRYFRNEKNCGAVNVVDNWNRCLEYAQGEFVICMGDDDRLLPECLAQYEDLIRKYPSLDVFHAWTQVIDESSQVIELQESRPEWESALAMQYYRWDHRWRQYIGDFCFRTSALRQYGGFYKLPLAWGSDDVTVFRAAMGKGIANMQQFGFQYRKSAQTITSSGHPREKAEAHLLEWKWFDAILKGYVCQDAVDSQFLSLLRNHQDAHYRAKIGDMMDADLTESLRNLSYWFRRCQDYGFTKREILSLFFHILRRDKKIRW